MNENELKLWLRLQSTGNGAETIIYQHIIKQFIRFLNFFK